MTEKSQKQQAVGSLWNVNSWHWEMKNYTDISKKILEQKFLELVIQMTKQITLVHTKVSFPKAEAEVNIRKGKQILVYDFELELEVKGENDEEESNGSYKVKEILNDDLTDMVIEEVRATGKNKVSDEMKKYLKKNVKEQVINVFKEFQAELKKIEADPTKLMEDKKKRQEAIEATTKARQEKGAEKERLLDQQRKKEKQMKDQAYRKQFQAKKEQ